MTEFQQHGVVPDTIPAPPPAVASIQYGTSNHVNLGNVLSIASTQTMPTILAAAQHGVYHTIMMIDPDALSRSTHEYRHFLHWLIVNVEGQGGGQLDFNKDTHTICPYMGPAPPPGTGYHRYICLIYQQHSKVDTTLMKPIAAEKLECRQSFNPHTWMQQAFPADNIPVLTSGNFFLAGTADESNVGKSQKQIEEEAKGGSSKDKKDDKAAANKDKDDKSKK